MTDAAARKGFSNSRGAGRPPARLTWKKVQHVARPAHDACHPVHVTMRAVRGLDSLRGFPVARAIGLAFHGAKRRGRRVVQFTIQDNHLHLIFEGDDRRSLMRDIRGVAIAIAKRVNRALRRKGQVFDDRYHQRALTEPRTVRATLVYVLMNHKKHGVPGPDIDPMSSARWFDGWRVRQAPPTTPSPVTAPRTKLAATSWRKSGLIDPTARPKSAPLTAEDIASMASCSHPLEYVLPDWIKAQGLVSITPP